MAPTLPFIDRHCRSVDLDGESVWRALVDVVGSLTSDDSLFVRLWDCEPAVSTEEFSGREGQAVPGFRVMEATWGGEMVLRGRHRFAEYRLTLTFEEGRLCAATHARFPGLHGKLYRLVTVTSGAHSLVVRRLLRRVERVARGRTNAPT